MDRFHMQKEYYIYLWKCKKTFYPPTIKVFLSLSAIREAQRRKIT